MSTDTSQTIDSGTALLTLDSGHGFKTITVWGTPIVIFADGVHRGCDGAHTAEDGALFIGGETVTYNGQTVTRLAGSDGQPSVHYGVVCDRCADHPPARPPHREPYCGLTEHDPSPNTGPHILTDRESTRAYTTLVWGHEHGSHPGHVLRFYVEVVIRPYNPIWA